MRRRRRSRVSIAAALLCAAASAGAAHADLCAFVSNAADNSVSVVDVASGTVTRTIRVGRRPAAVTATPDGQLLYVGNADDPDEEVDHMPGVRDTLSVIETGSGRTLDMVEVGRSPHGIAVTPDGHHVFEADTFQGTVSVIDTSNNEVVQTLPAGGAPVFPAISPDGSRFYVGDSQGGNVRVIDTASYQTLKTIAITGGPSGIAFHPDGSRAYVAAIGADAVDVIDTGSLQVVGSVENESHPFAMAVAPGRQTLYVGLLGTAQVGAIDMHSDMGIGTIDVGTPGDFPFFAAISPDERRLYVVLRFADSVAVVDLDTQQRIGSFATGREPRGIAVLDLDGPCPGDRLPDLWSAATPLSSRRQEIAGVELGGYVYAVGGLAGASQAAAQPLASVERYDPERDQWEMVAPLPTPLHHPAAATVGGRLYVIGGFETSAFTAVDSVYAYDPTADHWESRAPLPAPRGAATAAVIDGRIYVAGGLRDSSVDDFAVYDPAANQWTSLPPMPTARDHLGSGVIGGIFYAAGGRTAGDLTGVVEAYDPSTGAWRSNLAPMPEPRAAVAAAVAASRLFVFGGEGNPARSDGTFPQVEAYNPRADLWESFPDMRWPRHGSAAVALGRRVAVLAGGSIEGFGPTAGNEVFTLPGTACAGDCHGDGKIRAVEVNTAVAALFSDYSDPACPQVAFDTDGDGRVAAAEVLATVISAGGCRG